MSIKNETKLTKTQIEKLQSLKSKSEMIRFLDSEGFSRGDITRVSLLKYDNGEPIRYQHVRNVLTQKVNKK